MKHFHRIVPPLVLCLLLSSCTWNNENQEEEPTPEEDEGSSNAPLTWVEHTTMHKTILRMVEEENGDLEAWGPEDDPAMEGQSPQDDGTDIDTLIEVGMLAESDDGYTIASDAELDQLPNNSEIPSSVLGSAMESVLTHNEVRWCGEPESGWDFKENYLEAYS